MQQRTKLLLNLPFLTISVAVMHYWSPRCRLRSVYGAASRVIGQRGPILLRSNSLLDCWYRRDERMFGASHACHTTCRTEARSSTNSNQTNREHHSLKLKDSPAGLTLKYIDGIMPAVRYAVSHSHPPPVIDVHANRCSGFPIKNMNNALPEL